MPCVLANTIAPGTLVSPDIFTNSSGYTLLGSLSGNINPSPGSGFDANYTEWVYKDVNNVFCKNCLDFFVQFKDLNSSIVERLDTAFYGGFSVDVGYNSAGITGGPSAPTGGLVPSIISRSADGNQLGFFFFPQAVSNDSSALLEIQTNAQAFGTGLLSMQDGVAGFGSAFEPTVVPEPRIITLLVGACLLLGMFRRRPRLN